MRKDTMKAQISAACFIAIAFCSPGSAADYQRPLKMLPEHVIFLKPTLSCDTLQQAIDNRGQCELLDAGREWLAYDVPPGIKLDNGYSAFCTGSMFIMSAAPTTGCGWSIAREKEFVRR